MNTTIWLLTVNDVFTWGMVNVVTILIGLYLSRKLDVDATEVVGVGTGILFLTRALVQIPFGLLGDRTRSDLDEVIMLMSGNLLMGVPIILYTQVTTPWHYYCLQVILGIGAAMNIVNWRKLFAKHLDKGKEGFQYAFYDSTMSLSIAAIGICSGLVASMGMGSFDWVIGTVGALICLSNFWIISLYTANKRLPQVQS